MTKPKPKQLGLGDLLERSVEVLESEAAMLRSSHVDPRGRWVGEHSEAKAAHDEMVFLAKGLRRAHRYHKRMPLGGPAVIFEACASAIRAGDSVKQAMAAFGLQFTPKKKLVDRR